MTILEAINRIDAVKPNAYTQVEKIKWLASLDGMVKKTVIDTHEGWDFEYIPYTEKTPLSKELLIPSPYDDIYLCWLESKIDYYNGEYTRYNNSITRFNELFQEYQRSYNREYMPKGKVTTYF